MLLLHPRPPLASSGLGTSNLRSFRVYGFAGFGGFGGFGGLVGIEEFEGGGLVQHTFLLETSTEHITREEEGAQGFRKGEGGRP